MLITTTLTVAFLPEPSTALTVIVAVPFFTAVILPFEFTFATFVFELDHTTFLLAPDPDVFTVALIVVLLPFTSCTLVLLTLTLVTLPLTTLIVVVNFAPHPSLAVAVILAVPFFTALITPLELTVATLLLLLDHLTDFDAPEGVASMFAVILFPFVIVKLFPITYPSFVFATSLVAPCLTVIFKVSLIFGDFLDATVIVALPVALIVSFPLELTLTTFLLLDL